MRAIRPSNRRSSLWLKLLLGLLILVIGGVGTVGALGAMKIVDLQRLAFWRKPESYPPDWVKIPRCFKPVPAYTAITFDYLDVLHVSPEDADKYAKKGILINLDEVRGRVTARSHIPGFCFTESDFLPKGTRSGVAGGTPLGKESITLDVSKLEGAYGLKEGDTVDLLTSIPVDMPGAGQAGNHMGANVVSSPDMALLPKRGIERRLVHNGVVVSAVRSRLKPISSSSLTQGMTTRTMPVEEIVIAVEPKEAMLLLEAIALKYEITCVAQSGRPSTDGPKEKPREEKPREEPAELNPLADTRYVEVMIGGKRQYMVFTGAGTAPRVALQEEGSAAPETTSRSPKSE